MNELYLTEITIIFVFYIFKVSNYVITSCRQNWMTLPLSGQSIASNNINNNNQRSNEISIHVIPLPTTGVTSNNRKLFLCAPQSSVSHMSKWRHLIKSNKSVKMFITHVIVRNNLVEIIITRDFFFYSNNLFFCF